MANVVSSLQAAVVARLESDPNLEGIEVIAEDRGDLDMAIELAMAQLGICILVGTLKVGAANPNLPGPVFDRVTLSCSVTENVTINRSGDYQDAMSVAIKVAERLQHWRLVDVDHFSGRTCTIDGNSIEYQQQGDLLAYDVNFNF